MPFIAKWRLRPPKGQTVRAFILDAIQEKLNERRQIGQPAG